MSKEFSKLNYKLNCHVLKAEEFGVPQKRKRVFIIGVRADQGEYKFPGSLIKDPFTVKDAISNLEMT